MPPIDATIGISIAKETSFSIAVANSAIDIEAKIAVIKFIANQPNLLLAVLKAAKYKSPSPNTPPSLCISSSAFSLIRSKTSSTVIIPISLPLVSTTGAEVSSYWSNRKATSFSKPELEILEDDVKCKHGASFGEIDNNSIFYMQSRGIKKKDAIILLIHAFINEIGLDIENNSELSRNLIDEFFNQINEK